MPDLRIIAGPTGAGKSAIALRLAERYGARIISADSRQIYRGFDIGTAKPSLAEQRTVPHVGIDVADPTERWNAAQWAAEATKWIVEDAALGRPSVVVGGTGLWLKALVQPLADEPKMDPVRRSSVQAELAAMSTEDLRVLVQERDPVRAHLGRTQLLRAAEVVLVTGVRISAFHERGSTRPVLRARWLVVDPAAALEGQLNARCETMLEAGWLDEVRLLSTSVPDDARAWNACGYREIREVVQGTRTLDDALPAVRISTRQYAKRQRTWFRNQLMGPVTRLDPTTADAAAVAEQWFTEDNA